MSLPPPDLRCSNNKPWNLSTQSNKVGKMAADCHAFVRWMYLTVAETLPNLDRGAQAEIDVIQNENVEENALEVAKSTEKEEVEVNGVEVDKSTENFFNEVEENEVQKMYDLHLGDSAETCYTSLIMDAPASGMNHKRYLPPGSWYDMFLLYKGSRLARGTKPASFSTFSVW